jgi:hypothetical protein
MPFNQPLDLWNILVGTLSGSQVIFLALALITIAILAAKFKMNNFGFLIMVGLFGIFVGVWITWFYAVVIMVAGLAIGFVIAKIIKQ